MSSMTPWRGGGRRGELSQRSDHPFDLFHREFNDLFDRFFGGMMAPWGQSGRQNWGMDVSEEGNEFVVRADLPGFDPEDVNITLDNDVLTIQAEGKQSEKGGRSYRSFFRSFTVPHGINAEQVRADYRNGVLELHLPKPAQASGKRIPVGGQRQQGQTTTPAAEAKGGKGEAREHAKAGTHGGKA